MGSYGIKISRPGFDVRTAKPNQLSFSSAYKTLKVHSSGSGSILDGSRTVTIPHGLGYVPLFMVHATGNGGSGSVFFSSGQYGLLPLGTSGVLADPSLGVSNDLFAYADATNLYIKAQDNFGNVTFDVGGATNSQALAAESTFYGAVNGFWAVGADSDPVSATIKGAFRFDNIIIPQGASIVSAIANIKIQYRGGSGNVKMRVYGIDEDDTSYFDGGTFPTGRPKTTAFYDSNTNHLVDDILEIPVTSLVQEIVNRGGWNSGNAIGFITEDNGSSEPNWYENDNQIDGSELFLKVLLNSTLCDYKYTIFINKLA